jgi:hypothetical protein
MLHYTVSKNIPNDSIFLPLSAKLFWIKNITHTDFLDFFSSEKRSQECFCKVHNTPKPEKKNTETIENLIGIFWIPYSKCLISIYSTHFNITEERIYFFSSFVSCLFSGWVTISLCRFTDFHELALSPLPRFKIFFGEKFWRCLIVSLLLYV